MDNIFSVQYEAKGSTEFLIPFAILNEKEIHVFVNNNLQNKNNYIIKYFN